MKIPVLDWRSVRVVRFVDASFANSHDLSYYLGQIFFLEEKTNRTVPMNFKSYKEKLILRSAMAEEVISFSDLFDVAFTLSEESSDL